MTPYLTVEPAALNAVACPAGAGVTACRATGAWSGVTATASGQLSAGSEIVAVTLLRAMLMTDTVLLEMLATKAVAPSGVTATPIGCPPPGMMEVTLLVAVLITHTLPARRPPAGLMVPAARHNSRIVIQFKAVAFLIFP
jgi:hypothetical protein